MLSMKIVEEKEITTGFITVADALVEREDGTQWSRQFVRHPGAVCILALDADENIYMISQPREAILKDRFLELPAGLIDPGERDNPIKSAKRELWEEVGLKAHTWEKMFESYSACGMTDEKLYFFLAKDVYEASGAVQDESEDITIFKMTRKEAREALRSGEIEDGKTVQALSHFLLFY